MGHGTMTVIVNGSAGGGSAQKRVHPFLDALSSSWELTTRYTVGPGHATQLAREAKEKGHDAVVSVGGDGTLFEVTNGLGEEAGPALGVLPLGTGNSFLRDFGHTSPESALSALLAGETRATDVMRATHTDGSFLSINLLSVGFTAVAGELTNRRFKGLGALGYVAAVLVSVARLTTHPIVYRVEGGEWERAPTTLLSFNNTQCTGGEMRMAPEADAHDGLIDVVRVEAMGRRELLTTFPRIFSGTHVASAKISTTKTPAVDFELAGPVDIMVDGEIVRHQLTRLEVLPGAMEVLA